MDTMTQKEFIFGSLFLLANRLQVLGDRWDKEITMKQWFLIVMIAQFKDYPPTLTEVAEFMGSSRQNVKQLALKLEKKNFLHIEKDEKDSRALRLILTEACHSFFAERRPMEEAFLEALYKDLTEEEMKGLYRGLYQLGENIFEMDRRSIGGEKI